MPTNESINKLIDTYISNAVRYQQAILGSLLPRELQATDVAENAWKLADRFMSYAGNPLYGLLTSTSHMGKLVKNVLEQEPLWQSLHEQTDAIRELAKVTNYPKQEQLEWAIRSIAEMKEIYANKGKYKVMGWLL